MIKLSVGSIFSDGMVIQRNKETFIWGKAPAGKTVSIRFAGRETYVTAVDDKWKTKLHPVPAGGPYNLEICCDNERICIKDILAGEVWIAGGQSNMEWPLKATAGGKEAVSAANCSQVRHYNVQKVIFPGQMEEIPEKFTYESLWRSATSENAGEFSAVAFHFAMDIHEKLNVPVGIVECNLGGSSASAWMSEEYLKKDADTASYLEDYNEAISGLDLDDYNKRCSAAERLIYQSNLPSIFTDTEMDKPLDFSGMPDEISESFKILVRPGPRFICGSPGKLYETMLSTIIPYTCRGVIFYQGESDDVKGRIYGKLFSALIENWRHDFENEEMYFLFVQLAAYGRDGYPEGELYPILREQQKKVADTVPNTGMAVAMDLGSLYDIHPRRKAQIGKRLALIAREKVYHETVESSGPVFRSMEIRDGKIIVHFDHTGSGLYAAGDKPMGFRICGSNRKYFIADAEISGDTVVLSSPEVPMPEAASYGWANYMEVNLYNSEGLPAVPFRTDKYL